jgi:hypothetical protein
MIFRCGWRHLPYLEMRIFLGVGPGSIRTWKWFLSAGQLAIVLHILTLLKKWGALTSVFCSSVLQGLQLVYKRGDQASCKGGGVEALLHTPALFHVFSHALTFDSLRKHTSLTLHTKDLGASLPLSPVCNPLLQIQCEWHDQLELDVGHVAWANIHLVSSFAQPFVIWRARH